MFKRSYHCFLDDTSYLKANQSTTYCNDETRSLLMNFQEYSLLDIYRKLQKAMARQLTTLVY